MEFDPDGIHTVATKVLVNAAGDLGDAHKRITNADLAGAPFADSVPTRVPGERMFEDVDKAWSHVFGGLLQAMEETVKGINFTAQMLLQMEAEYRRTEFGNTDMMNEIMNVDLPSSSLRTTLDGGTS